MPQAVFNPNNYLIWDIDRYGVTIKLDNSPGGIPPQLISCAQLQLIQQAYVEESIKCARRFRARNPNLA